MECVCLSENKLLLQARFSAALRSLPSLGTGLSTLSSLLPLVQNQLPKALTVLIPHYYPHETPTSPVLQWGSKTQQSHLSVL